MTCLKLSLFAPAKSHSYHYSNYSIHNVGKNELGLFRRCSSSLINTGNSVRSLGSSISSCITCNFQFDMEGNKCGRKTCVRVSEGSYRVVAAFSMAGTPREGIHHQPKLPAQSSKEEVVAKGIAFYVGARLPCH